ncbi:SRPBCC family protein [Actinokineospora auranticolor]|uniref:Polyketide cyclase/dehydrase/lipid transport protein n=1 Tax=Actinokineospora auranticolor TaxID=155976 RepID=A0A2S6GS16_9PSEU|nr:SRPBCC family protein [Actinokineospora auranticolor]PPK67967.1 polyketide cyclase/dehydrase/lipid transport protein [Actinokineospora auranticolor]
MTTPDAQATIEVRAPAERVYDLVSDLPALAGVAAEFAKGHWLDDVTTARVGARFKGVNVNGPRKWATVSTVTDARPERFAFDVTFKGIPVARWQYDIEPTASGCRVTETTWDRRPAWIRPITALGTGVSDRTVHNQRNIEQTLATLKAAAERA